MPEEILTNEWAMWANEHAFVSAIVMLMGGITGVFGFDGAAFAYYTIVASVFVLIVEYPRGMRRKGNTVERRFQSIFHPILLALSPVTTNYFIRFFLYLLLSVPCIFMFPTLLGGICLFIAALIYFKAALGGESWSASTSRVQRAKTLTNRPPENPPPRPPPQGAPNEGFTEVPLEQIPAQ
ncbi:cytochrome b-245 light chain [Strongylocentrotus purpuratus]|uniref:Cytochrome b-245 light chain n=1 Tax=Strongylocentrotus purpuratus TaxID=7668 RepID=A0A7M7N7Z2_STRPU|nr:cytochrome b-245 light chain [Strongylocentrotus purpuratus]